MQIIRLQSFVQMAADQEDVRRDARALEFRCDGRHARTPSHDSPRQSLPDVYCPQCSWVAADSVSPAPNGIDYLRYWDYW